MKSGGTTTTTENKSTQLPQYAQDAQKNLLGTGQNLISQFTGGNPNYSVMGLTPDQLTAQDLTRQTAQGVFQTPQIPAYDVFGMGKDWNTGSPVSTPTAQAGQASVTNANAAQLDPSAISNFMNPYINSALNPALDRLRQQNGEVQAKIGADAAGSHMFGGSREAVSRMLADRNYRDAVGTTTGNMLNAGWNTASGLAGDNTKMQQQTALANAGAANDISKTNAGLTTQANMQGAQLNNQAALQQQNLAYQGSQNDASRFLQGLQMQSGLDTQNLTNKMNIINMLNGMGGQQRAVGQQAIDAPFTALQRLAGITPTQYGTTSTGTGTSETQKPVDILGTLLGVGKLAAGFA
jgi:hypothetical protein